MALDKVFKSLGATSHLKEGEREQNDYYATDPVAVELLLKENITFNKNILEPSCGAGHISKVLIDKGFNVTSRDLIDRGYGEVGRDFLTETEKFDGDIITNPPYCYAEEFLLKSLELIPEGNTVALLLKVLFLEGKKRGEIFKKFPPKYIYVSRSRISCRKNGIFDKKDSSAIAYAWYIWQKGFTGEPIIRWFN